MELSVILQSFSLLFSLLSGILCGMIYDFLKLLKEKLKPNRFFKNLYDIILVIILFIFFFTFFLNYNGFNLRIYHILTVLLGLILYFGLFYKVFCPIFRFFLNLAEKIFIFLLYPVKFSCKILLRVIWFLFDITKKIIKWFRLLLLKPANKIKRLLKRRKKVWEE